MENQGIRREDYMGQRMGNEIGQTLNKGATLGTPPVSHLPQVAEQCDYLDKALVFLQEQVSDTRERLSPVLFEDLPPTPSGGQCVPTPSLCPLAERLSSVVERINRAALALEHILGQLEV